MNICVYGASSNAISPIYIASVEKLGECMAKRGHTLVFGGGASGCMGASARGVKRGGGRVIGIAPGFFRVDGVLFKDCDEFFVTETMRERKQLLEDKSEGFVIAPGGVGTYDEFFEILTLKQLGRHNKPIAIFNVDGYYDIMLDFLRHTAQEDFMNDSTLSLYHVFDKPEDVVKYIEEYDEPAREVSYFKKIQNDD